MGANGLRPDTASNSTDLGLGGWRRARDGSRPSATDRKPRRGAALAAGGQGAEQGLYGGLQLQIPIALQVGF